MDVQTATVVITGISIIIGVILSVYSRRQELETRQADLFMQIYNLWSTRAMSEQYITCSSIYRFKDARDWSIQTGQRTATGQLINRAEELGNLSMIEYLTAIQHLFLGIIRVLYKARCIIF